MIILDTNVVSEFMKLQPNENVVKWLYSIPTDEIWTTRNINDFRFSGIKLIDPWQFTP